jgi:hypothetical protein
MTAKTCKAILENGQPCPNLVEGNQDYCPYHLANQTTMPKKAIGCGGMILGALGTIGMIVFGVMRLLTAGQSKKRKSKGRKKR